MSNFLKVHLNILKEQKFVYPEVELRVLLNKSSNIDKEIIFSNFQLNQINCNLFNIAFNRRIKNEPISKIFNNKYFWKYNFFVNQNVLDPRPETELIIEQVLQHYNNKKQKINILDIGTGSGCLAISLAKEYFKASITATDISSKALEVANLNAKKLNCLNRIKFLECNLINCHNYYDVIVSNPPYLTAKDYQNVSKDVKLYDPKIALFGGYDGLLYYRNLASLLPKIMSPSSLSFIEIGKDQKTKCIDLFEEKGMCCIDIIKDMQNFDRLLILKKINVD